MDNFIIINDFLIPPLAAFRSPNKLSRDKNVALKNNRAESFGFRRIFLEAEVTSKYGKTCKLSNVFTFVKATLFVGKFDMRWNWMRTGACANINILMRRPNILALPKKKWGHVTSSIFTRTLHFNIIRGFPRGAYFSILVVILFPSVYYCLMSIYKGEKFIFIIFLNLF